MKCLGAWFAVGFAMGTFGFAVDLGFLVRDSAHNTGLVSLDIIFLLVFGTLIIALGWLYKIYRRL